MGGPPSQAGDDFVSAIDDAAGADPDAVAFVDDEGELTRGELRAEVERVARVLWEHDVRPGDALALWMPNSRWWAVTFLAAASIGVTTVAVNTGCTAYEVGGVLDKSGASILAAAPQRGDAETFVADVERVVGGAHRLRGLATAAAAGQELPSVAGADIWRVDLRSSPASVPLPPRQQSSEEPVIVFTSSGTTGDPKLIVHSRRGLTSHVAIVKDAFALAVDTPVLVPMAFCGAMGLENMLVGLTAGAPVVCMSDFDGERATRLIARYEVSMMGISDVGLRRILQAGDATSLRSLRDVAFGSIVGDPLELTTRAAQLGFRAFQTYGSSEFHAFACYPAPHTDLEQLSLGGGRLIAPEYRARVVDDAGEPLPDGESGNLEVISPHMFLGYLRDGEIHQTLTADGYFRTGDLAHATDDGFVFLSRKGDALRLGGFLVEAREIESFIETLPGVSEVVVVGASQGDRPVAVAFVISDPGVGESDVIDACRQHLAKFKVPAAVEFVEEFPTVRAANGNKIRRAELRTTAQDILDTRRAAASVSA